MILADVDIADALDGGRIVVDPEPTAEQIQPSSLDLRLGDHVVDVAEGRALEPDGGTYRIHPGRFYRAATLESVTLPNDLAASIENRSTFAREGLLPHLAAGLVDPGWSGVLTLEMVNFMAPIDIDIGERIVQLVFETLMSESSGYEGKYQGADGAMGAIRDSRSTLPFDEGAYGMH